MLAEYWESFFYLRRLTLFDFVNGVDLQFDETLIHGN
jgi:hypothetical protein